MNKIVFLLLLVLFAGHNMAQPPVQVPVKKYDAAGVKSGDSLTVNRWMKQVAASELLITDSLLYHFTFKDSVLLSSLASKALLCHFILGHFKEVITTAEQYKNVITAIPAFSGAPFPELVAFAKAQMNSAQPAESSYPDALEICMSGVQPENKKALNDYLDDRMKYVHAYFRIYQQRTGDSLSSKDLDMYLWIYAGYLLPLKERSSVLRYTAQYESTQYVVNEDVRIPLADGTQLRAMVIYPKQPAKAFPVVLRVNCYPAENSIEKWKIRAWADSGYAGVTVYPRGKGGSQGVFYPFENDAADNYAVIDWISKQSWCNGKVGMYGGSYLGFTQWAAMKKVHPALKTIVPQVAVGIGLDYPNANGVFIPYMLQWLKYVRNGVFSDTYSFNDAEKWDSINTAYIRKGIAFNRLDSMEGGMDTIFQRWLKHPAYDSYWQQMTPTREEFARINIPILTTTGFFDDDQRGALYYYRMHNAYGKPEVVKDHYLLIGPYDHGGGQGGRIKRLMAPYVIDSAAMIKIPEIVGQWFDYWLKGGKKPAFLKDRVSVFVMGENKWHSFHSVSNMNKDTLQYLLSAANTSSDSSLQLLSPGKQAVTPGIVLNFYTANAIDTMDVFSVSGGSAPEKVFQRKDAIRFVSEPLSKSIILNGTFIADLWLSSSAPDADIQFGLWEIDSTGKRWPLSFTFQRLSHSQDITRRLLWTRDKVYHVVLKEAHWMSKRLEAGSKLMLVISPLSGASFEKNYGGNDPVSSETVRDARNIELKIHTSRKYPSVLKVPVF